ncbi:MAG TPA: DUF2383 domain-containing protein [Polyangiales bacterium]|nr:DUF2383 domain-containing protein [Polyangiales bacterium]
MASTQEQSVDTLNSFLRGEMSAVETYRQALDKITQQTLRAPLQECMQSHAQRVTLLTTQIRDLGGSPAEGSGVWGAFAKAVEGSAKAFGDKSAIAALEEGEDHGRNDYRRDLDKLDASSRQLVQSRVMPEQERTHNTLSSLKKALA